MNLKLELRKDELLWNVTNAKGIVAKLFLDSFQQITAIVLFSPNEWERKKIIELCCNHIYRFIKYRYTQPRIIPVIKTAPEKSEQIEKFSEMLMDFYAIVDELQEASLEEILKIPKAFSIPVIEGKVPEFEDALKASIGAATATEGTIIQYKLENYHPWSNSLLIELSSNVPLTFWKDSFCYKPEYESIYLNLIPDYHPAQYGKNCLMINGYTDAYLPGEAIGMVYSPEESRSAPDGCASWGHMKHPYFATGHTFKVAISRTHFLSENGMLDVTNLIEAVLQTSEKYYVGVNGGFKAPYISPHNRLCELLLVNVWPRPRGSEAEAVWEYRTLQNEGVLDKAFIPKWFFEEKWLKLYEDVPEQHGVY